MYKVIDVTGTREFSTAKEVKDFVESRYIHAVVIQNDHLEGIYIPDLNPRWRTNNSEFLG